MRLVLTSFFFLAGAAAAMAGVESCDKIKDADAYNACLASFGPAVHAHQYTATPPAEISGKASDAVKEAVKIPASKRRLGRAERKNASPPQDGRRRQANGRVRIEIIPGR